MTKKEKKRVQQDAVRLGRARLVFTLLVHLPTAREPLGCHALFRISCRLGPSRAFSHVSACTVQKAKEGIAPNVILEQLGQGYAPQASARARRDHQEPGILGKAGVGKPDSRCRHVTDSWQSRTSETCGLDHAVPSNTAKHLPQAHSEAVRPAPASVAMPKSWSWAGDAELCQPHGQQSSSSRHKEAGAPALELYTASVVERRLAQTHQAIEEGKESRRQGHTLKKSRRYLGVQGINPVTGQLDLINPTGNKESTGPETQQTLNGLGPSSNPA